MRLLSKREIDQAKTADRQREAAEGMKLAKRVDVLRETSATEEANLNKMRVASLEQLHLEIEPLAQKKEDLLSEVRDLEERREKALLPFTKEKVFLEDWETALLCEEELVNEKLYNLSVQEDSLAQRKKQIDNEEGRIADFKRTTSENLVQSENSLKRVGEMLEQADEKAQLVETIAILKDKEASHREAKVAVRERELKMLQANITQRETRVIARERMLRDREIMLEKNIKLHQK